MHESDNAWVSSDRVSSVYVCHERECDVDAIRIGTCLNLPRLSMIIIGRAHAFYYSGRDRKAMPTRPPNGSFHRCP